MLAIGKFLPVLLGAICISLASASHAERLKDLASIQGVRQNQLMGYGLVVGLDGSGDQTTQTPFTVQSVMSMLQNMGVNLPPGGASLQLKNVAAVMVTSSLPAFAQPGQTLDVTVSSMGNAKSLRGGTLLMTPLKGADGQIYGMAQGNVVVGGAGAAANGSQAQINHLSVGRISAKSTSSISNCGRPIFPPPAGWSMRSTNASARRRRQQWMEESSGCVRRKAAINGLHSLAHWRVSMSRRPRWPPK
jgi:flagellar P-ring protein precursor FlgI